MDLKKFYPRYFKKEPKLVPVEKRIKEMKEVELSDIPSITKEELFTNVIFTIDPNIEENEVEQSEE
jgi:hypothetical protein